MINCAKHRYYSNMFVERVHLGRRQVVHLLPGVALLGEQPAVSLFMNTGWGQFPSLWLLLVCA